MVDGRPETPREREKNFTAEAPEFAETGVFLNQELFTRRSPCLRGEYSLLDPCSLYQSTFTE